MTNLNMTCALAPVDHEGNQMIDARSLHGWLNCKQRFNDWIRERIETYGFEPEADFYCFSSKTGGRPRTDYLLTLDMAKELSMIERTDKGRAARRYFIQMEKAAVQMATAHLANGTPEAIPQETLGLSYRTPVDHEGNQMIDARSLHGWLGTEARFADWITRRVKEYGFEDGSDYFSELRKNGGRGRGRKEYLLTLDMAKELSMIERTDKGVPRPRKSATYQLVLILGGQDILQE